MRADQRWVARLPEVFAGTVSVGVREALESAKFAAKSSQMAMVAKNTTPVTEDAAGTLLRLVETLDDHDDVQNVWAHFDISDEDLAAFA